MACTNHPDVLVGLDRCSRCGKEFCESCVITLQGALVCAGCKTEQVKDIQSGTRHDLELTGPGSRFGAQMLDMLVIFVVVVALFVAIHSLPGDNSREFLAFFLVVAMCVPALYEAIMLLMLGQTLGKMAIQAKVVDADGSPLKTWQPWVRGLSRSLMGIVHILGLIDALLIFGKDRATLHDRIARTRVVRIGWKRAIPLRSRRRFRP